MLPRLTLAMLLVLLPPAAGLATEQKAPLVPGPASVSLRLYALGLFPLDGMFRRFDGVLRYDPADRSRCTVSLNLAVASLVMDRQGLSETVTGPVFLDAARYPKLRYEGRCSGRTVTGRLTMHGVTRPFVLTLDWQPDAVTAVGRLRRAEWGMTARPLVGGSTVRISVRVRLHGG